MSDSRESNVCHYQYHNMATSYVADVVKTFDFCRGFETLDEFRYK